LTTQGIRLVTESINTKLPELFTTWLWFCR
jgi:hypothetical protein